MKTLILIIFISFTVISSAQLFEQFKKEALKAVGETDNKIGFTKEEAGEAIKEALSNGTEKVTELVSKDGGFLNNPEIKIPFPEDAKKIKSTLEKIGLKKQVEDVENSINSAAEIASQEAKEVFLKAIMDMSIKDAIKIVKGDDNSATVYLDENTREELTQRFKPIIEKALEKSDATKYWEVATKSYNKVPFTKKVNTDLIDYTNRKALDGLFLMISKEEKKIRENPIEQTTELLKKVFGS